MKITFIYPDVIGSADYTGIFNLGIGLLSSVLKENGYNTSLIHVSQPISRNDFIKYLEEEDADLYAFSTTTPMFYYASQWADWIKQHNPRKLILIGGIHAILNPAEIFQTESVDFVCTGEGEYSLLELCNALKNKQSLNIIQGIWSRQDNQIVKTPRRPLINNLDEIFFADRTIFNYKQLMEGKEEMFFVMASRGCPYDCPYCCNQSLRETISGQQQWVRFRSVDNVIAEIQAVLRLYPQTKFIGFYDDILALKKDWFEEFTLKYKKYIKLPFRCNMRADYLAREEITKMMYDAGCRRVIIGLESGNKRVRNGILKRNMPEEMMLEARRLCEKYKIEFATFNMVGLPGEGAKEILDTVKLNAKLNSDFTYTSIFYPFAGTSLYTLCEDKNLLTGRIITDYVEGSLLNFTYSAMSRVVFVRNFFRPLMNFYKLIYKLPQGIRGFSEKITDVFLGSKITAVTLFALANFLFSFVRDNKILAGFTNRIKRISKTRKISLFNSSVKKVEL